MLFSHIDILNFRNLSEISIDVASSVNFLCGPNASGKSSFLEALYLLSSGQSFRPVKSSHLIMHNESSFIVRANFVDNSNRSHKVGLMKFKNQDVQYKLDMEKPPSLASIAKSLPIRIIHPEMHTLISGGPSNRRKFLDWGAFYMNSDFYSVWKKYQFTLKQRNSLLKGSSTSKELESWNSELAKFGEKFSSFRLSYVSELIPLFKKWTSKFNIDENIEMIYEFGWDSTLSFKSALEKNLHICQRYRTTCLGPHRADLLLSIDGIKAKHHISRGQQKLLVFALVFSQIELFQNKVNDTVVLLCDDPKSELDNKHWNILLSAIREVGSQCFITGTHLGDISINEEDKVFSMKDGALI